MGGIQRVNETLAEALTARGYRVKNLYLRAVNHKEGVDTLRPTRPWSFTRGCDVLEKLKEGKIFSAFGLILRRMRDVSWLSADRRRAKRFLVKEKPDAVITSHYLLLDGIPKPLLSRTYHHVHTSFRETMRQQDNRKTLCRYRGKIGFLWLSRNICEKALSGGFVHSFPVYNPLSFYPPERTLAEKCRKVVVLTRFSEEKRLPLAVKLLKRAMDQLEDANAFSVSFYGEGSEEAALRDAIGSDVRFQIMPRTDDVFGVLKEARFTVNTSAFEGFSISILEAAAAGVPTVSFDFGEAASEEITNGKTGFVIPMDDHDAFVEALKRLFLEDGTVKDFSENARAWASSLQKETVAQEWERLLSRLPLDKTGKA